jgi:hypothetical protein
LWSGGRLAHRRVSVCDARPGSRQIGSVAPTDTRPVGEAPTAPQLSDAHRRLVFDVSNGSASPVGRDAWSRRSIGMQSRCKR